MNVFFQNVLNWLRPQQRVPLRPDALRVVHQLTDCSWFSSIGEPLPKPAYRVSTWFEAIQHATSLDYDDFGLERANEFRLSVYEREPPRLDSWNSVIKEIKRHSEPLVTTKLSRSGLDEHVIRAINGTVRWDLVHMLAAVHFSDVYRSRFYDDLLAWYLCGHFPCGWEGTYPEGKFIIL